MEDKQIVEKINVLYVDDEVENLNAFKAASDLGITSIALTGKDGGAAKKCSNQSIIVDSESTARIQEAHILIGHILCELIEERLHLV